MPELPRISGREAVRAFQRAGWEVARQRGSHVVLTKPGSIFCKFNFEIIALALKLGSLGPVLCRWKVLKREGAY